MRMRLLCLMVVSGLTAPACHAQSPQGQRATRAPADVETSMDAPSQPETRSGPASRFATLDEYLAFLDKGAAIDKAYYRKVDRKSTRLNSITNAPIVCRLLL